MSRRSTRIASQPTVTHYHTDGSITKFTYAEEVKYGYGPAIQHHVDGVGSSHGLRAKMHHINAAFTITLSRPDLLAHYPRFAATVHAKAMELIPQVPAGFTRTHVTLRRAIEMTSAGHP
jgi:hypothetical protein